jgi:hypothetical protein
MKRHKKYDLLQTLLLNMARGAERNHEKIRAGPVLRDFFLCNFALMLLENLHFLNLCDNFGVMPFGIANT